MAQSNLTQFFYSLRRDLGRELCIGRSFFAGSIFAVASTVTVNAGTPLPDNTADLRLTLPDGTTYEVATRVNDVQFTLDTPGISFSPTTYELHPWSNTKLQDIEDILRDGYQQFLVPPIVDPREGVYQWKFLRPVQSIIVTGNMTGTVTGAPTFDLPSGKSTVTLTGATIVETSVGDRFHFEASGNDYVVTDFLSQTEIELAGDASGEAAAQAFTLFSDSNYPLPPEFGTIDGEMFFARDQSTVSYKVTARNPIDLEELRATHTATTGIPRHFAVRPFDFDGAVGQRWELLIWPDVDRGSYELRYRGMVNPDLLTAIQKYGLGGMPHSATLRESILACGERTLSDAKGLHWDAFTNCLQSSISFDKKATGAETLGMNLDRGNQRQGRRLSNLVTRNGVLYGA